MKRMTVQRRYMHSLYTFLLALLLNTTAGAQNLLANSSFEDINYCQSNIPCCPSAWSSVSKYPYGYENDFNKPYHGKHTLALLIWSKDKLRTYWQTKILCDLQKGKTYQLTFYLYSHQTNIQPAFFGAFFSDKQLYSEGDTTLRLENYLSIADSNISSTKLNTWQKVVLPFIAKGAEKYLVLGNCNANEMFEIKNRQMLKYVDYYLDEVSLTAVDPAMKACKELKTVKDSLYKNNLRHVSLLINKETKIIPIDSPVVIKTSSTNYDTIVLGTINFNFDSYQLTNTNLLTQYFDTIQTDKIAGIEILGFTDSLGSGSYNYALSLKRAQTVKNFLLSHYYFKEIQITATGKGILKEKTNLLFNRKVEIIIQNKL